MSLVFGLHWWSRQDLLCSDRLLERLVCDCARTWTSLSDLVVCAVLLLVLEMFLSVLKLIAWTLHLFFSKRFSDLRL